MEGNILLVTSREGYTFRLDGEDYYRKVTRQHFNSHDMNNLIPSISDGVDFLRARGEKFLPNLFTEKPWEEMLKTMVKVLENQ